LKVLAVDYGSKRIGLALGDTNLKIATPLGSVENKGGLIEKIREIVEDYRVGVIVVGLPLTPRGNKGQRAKEVEEFVERLRHNFEDTDIVLWDERYTTLEAMSLLEGASPFKKRKLKDALSAYVILKEYLDSL